MLRLVTRFAAVALGIVIFGTLVGGANALAAQCRIPTYSAIRVSVTAEGAPADIVRREEGRWVDAGEVRFVAGGRYEDGPFDVELLIVSQNGYLVVDRVDP